MKHKPTNAPQGGVCKAEEKVQSYIKKPTCSTAERLRQKAKGKESPLPSQWID